MRLKRSKFPSLGGHRAVKTSVTYFRWMTSATSADNRVSDHIGALNLFWDSDWEYPTDFTLRMVDDDHNESDEQTASSMPKLAAVPELYRAKTIEKPLQEFSTHASMFDGKLLWLFDPRNFARIVHSDAMFGETARAVLMAIHTILAVRLSTAIAIMVNGKAHRVTDQIPHFRPTIVELRLDQQEQLEHDKIWEQVKRSFSWESHKS